MKVTDKELRKLQDFNHFMVNASSTLGDLQLQYESKKAQIINDIGFNRQKFNEFKDELEKEYGNVNINIQTGEITTPAEPENDGGH
jgi:oligoribonuclease NrnB/cAMP/cGMP phosphodiesterase (DHH superfamily)